jgi:hypothetical protein
MRILTTLCAVSALLPIYGADDAAHEIDKSVDFYLSLGMTVAPEVEEFTTGPSGGSNYIWNDPAEDFGQRIALGHLINKEGARGNWSLGVELVGTTTDITPSSYEIGGITFANTSSRTLRYSTAGALLHFGYQFGSEPKPEEISAFIFLAPFIGGGAAWADSEFGSATRYETGLGYYVEGGLRFGFAFAEKHFVLGFMVDAVIGTSTVNIDFDAGQSSELTLKRAGIGGALFAGYRL